MKSLAVRLTLMGLFVVATGVAAYMLSICETQARSDRSAARTFDAASSTAIRDALSLRADQQAYVASGQGEAFWTAKVAKDTAALRDDLNTLRAQATSLGGQAAVDNAASAVQDFEQMDGRARDYVRSGEKLMASDLIFADGLESTGAIATSLEQARAAERQSYEESSARVHRRELTIAAGITALAAIVILLLVPRRDRVISTAADDTLTTRSPSVHSSTSLDLGSIDRDWDAQARAAGAAAAAKPAGPAIDLAGIASLCSDLARVIDTRALPAILQRAAAVLDAPGIVLWIADPDGRELSPIVTHGYPHQVVSRLGTILRDAENATASAFRTSLLQTVDADAVSNGAIAAPLVTPAGCVGVMAAEVRHTGEKDAAKLAAATIIAAQLATLVGPPSTRAQAKAEAAGA